MLGLPTSWLLGGAAALLIATNGFTYFKATSAANANCNAAALRAELAVVRADLHNAEAAAAVAEAASRTLNAEAMDRDAQIREYERTLPGTPACSIDQRDIDSMSTRGGPR